MLCFIATVETSLTAEKSAGACPGGDGDNWFVRSHSLQEKCISALQPTDSDLQTMWDILMVVLGDEAIEKNLGFERNTSK